MRISVALDGSKRRDLTLNAGEVTPIDLTVYAVDGDGVPLTSVTNPRIVLRGRSVALSAPFTPSSSLPGRSSFRLLAEVAGATTLLAFGVMTVRGAVVQLAPGLRRAVLMDIPGFVGPAYTSISKAINAQRCVNLRLEVDLANGRKPLALVGLPGYRAVKLDFPSEPVRAFWRADDRTFVVVGAHLYELNDDLTHTERGALTTGAGPVSIADNGLQMLVVDGVGVLALTLATNATTSAIDNFPKGATFIVCIDNTFIANEPGTQRFNVSAVGDGLKWRAIDFASVEGLPDDLVAIVKFNRQLYMFGTQSLQIFWNSGDAERPFVALEGSFLEVGCIAPQSADNDESGVYWLGADARGGPRVYKAAGGQSAVISTPALDVEMARYGDVADARGMTFRMDGHVFYVLTFGAADKTWLFDATTEGWSEFLEWDGNWRCHRASCAIYTAGRQLIGDFANGLLYELSGDVYANDGRPLRALRASAHVSQDQMPITVGSVEVVCEHGVGLQNGQGSDPQMMLRTSRDGGVTWTPEMWRPIGKAGAYRGRTRFNRPCGAARDLVFEVSISDPIKRVIVAGVMNSGN